MALYSNSDITLLEKNIDKINEQVTLAQSSLFEPTISEREQVIAIILLYIKEQGLKVYGGYALNKFILSKNLSDRIYPENTFPDIDIYSATPIEDLITICNLISAAGFKRIHGREGKHKDTYNIYVNFQLYCNLTYVPKNILNRIPTKVIDEVYYVQPFFMTIDYLRIITDPLTSYWRLEKTFKRLVLMQKYYPLLKVSKPIQDITIPDVVMSALDIVGKFLLRRKSCISVGFLASNYFLKSVPGTKPLQLSYHEFISTSYKSDFDELFQKLCSEFPTNKFTCKEYCPFFQFIGNSCKILLNDTVICHIYSNYSNNSNSKAIPYQDIQDMRIGTFSLTLLYAQIMTFLYTVQNDKGLTLLYQTLVSNLLDVKAKYLNFHKKNIFDQTLFQEFITECVGQTIQPEREMLLRYEEHREKKKRAYFQYDPSAKVMEPETTWLFGNYSGNLITNPKNMLLLTVP